MSYFPLTAHPPWTSSPHLHVSIRRSNVSLVCRQSTLLQLLSFLLGINCLLQAKIIRISFKSISLTSLKTSNLLWVISVKETLTWSIIIVMHRIYSFGVILLWDWPSSRCGTYSQETFGCLFGDPPGVADGVRIVTEKHGIRVPSDGYAHYYPSHTPCMLPDHVFTPNKACFIFISGLSWSPDGFNFKSLLREMRISEQENIQGLKLKNGVIIIIIIIYL